MAAAEAFAVHTFSGWRSFQFIDPREEEDFRKADYEHMRMTHFIVCATQLGLVGGCRLAYDFESTPLGRSGSPFYTHMVALLSIQICQVGIRKWLFPGQPSRLGWFFFWVTLGEWIGMTYADVYHGFVILQSDTMFILLFFCLCLCQAILIFNAVRAGSRSLELAPHASCSPIG